MIEAIAVGEPEPTEELGEDAEEDDDDEEPDEDLDRLRVRLTPAGDPRVHRAGPPGGRRRPRRRARSAASRSTRPATSAPAQRLPPVTAAQLRTPLETETALRLLRDGELELEGRLVDASNTTLRGVVTLDGRDAPAASTSRSAANGRCGTSRTARWPAARSSAYLVSPATGWDLVPPTVLRDGPLGAGALPALDRRAGGGRRRWSASCRPTRCRRAGFRSPRPATTTAPRTRWRTPTIPRLARLAVLDVVINNADRKGGHVLHGGDDRIYGVDHGVSFHVEPKLRTVLWGWAGAAAAGARRSRGAGGAGRAASPARSARRWPTHLTVAEVGALAARVRAAARGRDASRCRRREWPAIPWPPI